MRPLIVLELAGRIADRLVRSPPVSVEAPEKPFVKVEAAKELQPVLEHLTNNEPWFRSRVTLGAIASILSGVLGLFGYAVGVEEILPILVGLGPIIGGGLALYGRWAARKPIGA